MILFVCSLILIRREGYTIKCKDELVSCKLQELYWRNKNLDVVWKILRQVCDCSPVQSYDYVRVCVCVCVSVSLSVFVYLCMRVTGQLGPVHICVYVGVHVSL